MTTALIADDESLLRDDLRDKLTALWPDLVIVAEAANGNEAADLIARHEPDIAFSTSRCPGRPASKSHRASRLTRGWCSSPPTTSTPSMPLNARPSTIC